MQYTVLALYIFDAAMCLLAIKRKNTHAYAASKPFLMPLLLGVYFAFLPESLRTAGYQKFVAIALFLHAMGDTLLLFPRNRTKKFFYMGMFCFFVGHLFYSGWFIKAPVGHSARGALLVLLLCLVLEYLLFRHLVLGPRNYAPVLVPYSFGLCMVAVSIAYTTGAGSPVYATAVSFCGIALFAFSDFCIMRRLVRLPLFGQMTVMSTYIAGQTLIVTGMLLLQIR